MRNFKKRTIALCLASAITVLGSFAADTYENALMSLRIDSGSNGNVCFTVFTQKPYDKTIRTENAGDGTFYITLPAANSEINVMPSLTGYENIDSVQIATFPYAPGVEGYTRITVKTKGEPIVSATTSLYIPDKSYAGDARPKNVISANNTKERDEELMRLKQQASYWDPHQEKQYAEKKAEAAKAKGETTTEKKSYKQKNTQSPDFNPNYNDMPNSGSNDRLPILIGIAVFAALILFIIFLRRDQMAAIVGDQKDFNFDDESKDNKKSKTKTKRIRSTINKLDDTYKNTQTTGKINIVTGAVMQEEEPVVEKTFEDEPEEPTVVVDLDSLYHEKTKSEKAEDVQIQEPATEESAHEEDAEDDLADFLNEFSFEEEQPQEPEEKFDEELYESTIKNENLNFSKDDSQRLNLLLQNEIGDETLNNIEEFAPKEPVAPPTEMEVLESVLAEYTIKQNLAFSKDDVDTIRKLINVELDEDFITDLRTNPQRTEAMRQEIENKEKQPHKTTEMLILNVKDLLPDLSKEMKKHGNGRIESEVKPDVVYYSEGYEVSKLSVSGDLANVSAAIHDEEANKFRPSDDLPIVENGYDVQTLSIKDVLPDIADYKKHPDKYETKKKPEEKIDEKALLNSIQNVQFKPFYENVQEEMSQFEGFEIVDNEREERLADEKALKELEKLNRKPVVHVKPKQTEKVKDEAQKLLDLIGEKQAERENKKQEEVKQETPLPKESQPAVVQNTAPVKKAPEVAENPTVCEIDGNSYNVVKSVKCGEKMVCYLTKKDNQYYVIGKKGGVYKILKQYDELSTENIQTRLNETKPDGSVQYLVRVSVHKFIINLTKTGMEFVMDLC